MPPVINRTRCTGCGTCASICNSHIFIHKPKEDKVPIIKFPDECWHCAACVLDCPADAISMRFPLAYTLLYDDAVSPKE